MINPKVNKTIEAISYALLYGGLVVVLFTIGTLNESAVSGTLCGYSSATLAVLFLFALSYTNYVSATTDSNTFSIKKIGLILALLEAASPSSWRIGSQKQQEYSW